MSSPEHAATSARGRAEALSPWTPLLDVARRSIEHGLRSGLPLAVDPVGAPAALRAPGACFVTLRAGADLRGCVGTLEAHRPLVCDAAHNAFAAAHRDPRFPPLRADERARIHLHVSVLGAPEPIRFREVAELMDAVEPGLHGLWIRAGARRATFLPQVWEQLPDPHDFLGHLLDKAGIPRATPAHALAAWRYTVDEVAGLLAPPA